MTQRTSTCALYCYQHCYFLSIRAICGGRGGIRTHGGFKPTLDFESSALNRTQPPFRLSHARAIIVPIGALIIKCGVRFVNSGPGLPQRTRRAQKERIRTRCGPGGLCGSGLTMDEKGFEKCYNLKLDWGVSRTAYCMGAGWLPLLLVVDLNSQVVG